MSDLVNQLETLVHNWANPNDAKSKIEELVKKFKTSPNAQNRINPDEILKVHPTGGRVEEGYGFEIALVYSKSGAATAAKLKPYLEHDLMMGLFFDFEATQDFDAELLEKNICNTLLTVVLLTKDTLKEPSVIFAMETLLHPEYHEKAKCVLVHDASSCFFPSGDEQASSIKHLFAEKAVTLLPEYITVAVDDILGRLEEIETKEILSEEGGKEQEVMTSTAHNHSLTKMTPYPSFICNGCKGTFEGEHFHCVLCQFDLCDECAEKTRESIETDCFLSHKRTTAQVIAGRLYEGLKTDYKVFLDSEAKFKIHDLEKIVEQTGLFVLILSAGYLDSYWCCQELRSALKFGRKTLVVRDLNYHLPPRESLPDSFNDIKAALYDSPTIPWVAEYNGACLSTIRRKFLGPPKKVLEEFGVWWGANEAELGKISEETGYFKLSSWEGKVNHVFEAFDVHAPGTNEEITAVDLSESELEDEEVIGLEQLPKLEKLNIASCVMGGSIKHLGRAAPKLASLDISRNALNDLMFMGMIRKLGSLTELDVSYCWNLTDVALHQIATKCKKLATIKVVGCNFSEEGFRGFQETLPNCQIIQE